MMLSRCWLAYLLAAAAPYRGGTRRLHSSWVGVRVRDDLLAIDGISRVNAFLPKQRELSIELNSTKMASMRVSPSLSIFLATESSAPSMLSMSILSRRTSRPRRRKIRRSLRDRRVLCGLGFCVNVGADFREFRLERGFPLLCLGRGGFLSLLGGRRRGGQSAAADDASACQHGKTVMKTQWQHQWRHAWPRQQPTLSRQRPMVRLNATRVSLPHLTRLV